MRAYLDIYIYIYIYLKIYNTKNIYVLNHTYNNGGYI